jgi:mannitol-1-phosphate 5-dehydrogenase
VATVLGAQEAAFGFDQMYHLSDEAKRETFSHRRDDPKSGKSGLGRHIDTCARVAADPVRKLARRDRLTGPALGVIKGGRIPFFLSRAIACYFYYENEKDPGTKTVMDYLRENGIRKAVERFCELDLSDDVDRTLHELVVAQYYDMYDRDINSIDEIK